MYTYYINIYKCIDTIVWDISKQTPQESIFYLLTFNKKIPFQEKNNVEQDKRRNAEKKKEKQITFVFYIALHQSVKEQREGGRARERHVCLSAAPSPHLRSSSSSPGLCQNESARPPAAALSGCGDCHWCQRICWKKNAARHATTRHRVTNIHHHHSHRHLWWPWQRDSYVAPCLS